MTIIHPSLCHCIRFWRLLKKKVQFFVQSTILGRTIYLCLGFTILYIPRIPKIKDEVFVVVVVVVHHDDGPSESHDDRNT